MPGNTIKGLKGFVSLPVVERFWSKVDKRGPHECWPWLGYFDVAKNLYPSIWSEGHHRKASQVSWEIANGKTFPPGLMACHSCDNIACVNPAHIWPGTMSQNVLDSVSKGRHFSRGSPLRTHCKQGHEFSLENTAIDPSTGHRICKQCKKIHNRKGAAARRARLGEIIEVNHG